MGAETTRFLVEFEKLVRGDYLPDIPSHVENPGEVCLEEPRVTLAFGFSLGGRSRFGDPDSLNSGTLSRSLRDCLSRNPSCQPYCVEFRIDLQFWSGPFEIQFPAMTTGDISAVQAFSYGVTHEGYAWDKMSLGHLVGLLERQEFTIFYGHRVYRAFR